MTNGEIFAVLRPIIQSATGYQVIMADQGAAAPKGPYCTIRPQQSIRQRGQAHIYGKHVGAMDDLQTTIKRQVICSCSINFYRGEARQAAGLVAEINKLPSVQMALARAKIGYGGTSAVNDLTGLQSANWEQRAQITLDLWYVTESQDVVNTIHRASLTLENERAEVLSSLDITTA